MYVMIIILLTKNAETTAENKHSRDINGKAFPRDNL